MNSYTLQERCTVLLLQQLPHHRQVVPLRRFCGFNVCELNFNVGIVRPYEIKNSPMWSRSKLLCKVTTHAVALGGRHCLFHRMNINTGYTKKFFMSSSLDRSLLPLYLCLLRFLFHLKHSSIRWNSWIRNRPVARPLFTYTTNITPRCQHSRFVFERS